VEEDAPRRLSWVGGAGSTGGIVNSLTRLQWVPQRLS
jgi:hypothetical protein